MSKSVTSSIVRETSKAIWNVLQPIYLVLPTKDKWKQISIEFEKLWQLPCCVGAMDGKHCAIVAPSNSGSAFCNYKKYFSIILFAVCDANYVFTYVDVGSYGSQSDGGVLRESEFGTRLQNGELNLPDASNLPNTNVSFSPFFVVLAVALKMHFLYGQHDGKSFTKPSMPILELLIV